MRSIQSSLMAAAILGVGALGYFSLPLTKPSLAAEPNASSASYAPSPLFKAEVMASNLRAPWAIKFLPDGRVMFTEREGRVRVIENRRLRSEPALTVPDIKSWSKMGLLGLVPDPNFAANHFIYTAEAHGVNDKQDGNWVRVVRYREEANKLLEPKVLIDNIPAFHNHAGGRLLFGPDGKLYITTGDADLPLNTQRLDVLHGKILRINSDGTIPADNPFVNKPDANPAIWSFGHRNSQGICFQPGTGDLYETEHGPDGGDEINLVKKGANYGWPFVTHDRTATGVENPLRQFTPSIGPGDCVFYDGDLFPALKGELLVAAMRGESILRAHLDGQRVASVERLMFKQFGRIREVAVAPDGAIWIATSEFDPPEGRKYADFDQVLRLTPAGGTVAAFDKPPEAKDIPKPVGSRNIYNTMCLSCHGDGRDLRINSNLFDKKWDITDGSDEEIRLVIQHGNIARGMPGFAGSLNEKEINEMIAYIRQREAAGK